jgi:hypothetical protein
VNEVAEDKTLENPNRSELSYQRQLHSDRSPRINSANIQVIQNIYAGDPMR